MRRGHCLLALLGLSGCASLPPIDVPPAAPSSQTTDAPPASPAGDIAAIPASPDAAPPLVPAALAAMEAPDATEARPLPLGHDLVLTTADGGRATVGIHEIRAGRRALAALAEIDPDHRPPACASTSSACGSRSR